MYTLRFRFQVIRTSTLISRLPQPCRVVQIVWQAFGCPLAFLYSTGACYIRIKLFAYKYLRRNHDVAFQAAAS
ncbi:hypothetical protein BCR43DRAFT_482586 [Syncephalastrum racemosum]|uniref:Uncharacterized protein n=1 Tax=Syncephalastrum racemosum TaxID=13706 RepID=A0A1X2HVA0_SYNRA|nr:hypothetical protein BCR43DRAFT_482586 [Syncephalastrum racemosum]